MGSRIRQNVKHFFECFCEVVPPTPEKEAWTIQQYPDTYSDNEVLQCVPKFAYPCKIENTVIQNYSFVLTDIESKWTFGFCRHDPKSETALVVLSYLPWHQAFYKFLGNVSVLTHSTASEDLGEFLRTAYTAKIPDPGKALSIPFNNGESKNLLEYYSAVTPNDMILIFASMLYERRIIFTSKKLTRLSACVQSANDIIYPMIWQHIFIPVLPMSLMDYLLAPMPFLIGVPEEVLKKVHQSEIGDVVLVKLDAETNKVETPFDDLSNLPQEVVSSLKKQLRNQSDLLGDAVSRAFLRALVQLIGGYSEAVSLQPGQKATFDKQKFIETRPASLQPFLKQMLHLQIFQQFIEERLQIINSGEGFSDEFEMEACRYSEKSSSKLKQQYKEWTSTMKKEGTAFFKSVKDKANPAMKSAVKTVKDGGKGMRSAYKGLRSKLRENQGPQQLHNGLNSSSDKPRSAPNSPTGKRRSLGFGVPTATYRKDSLNFKSSGSERPYSPLSPISQPMSPDATDRSRSGTPGLDIPRIDLMTEMQDLLQLRLETPPVDRTLKPVRSLENFKHSSPLSSPEHWVFPSRSSAAMTSPTGRLFIPNLNNQDTQNLLQSPDDVFSSPPVPPRTSAKNHEFFGTAPFVVGGGRSENGDPLFLVANRHSVDVVKLSPPLISPRRKRDELTEDLIRLDSTSDYDDFDPLKSNNSKSLSLNGSNLEASSLDGKIPLSLTNPLYAYYDPPAPKLNGNVYNSQAWPAKPKETSRKDQALLQEYGLDFNNFNTNFQSGQSASFDPFGANNSSKVNTKNQWTKFE